MYMQYVLCMCIIPIKQDAPSVQLPSVHFPHIRIDNVFVYVLVKVFCPSPLSFTRKKVIQTL